MAANNMMMQKLEKSPLLRHVMDQLANNNGVMIRYVIPWENSPELLGGFPMGDDDDGVQSEYAEALAALKEKNLFYLGMQRAQALPKIPFTSLNGDQEIEKLFQVMTQGPFFVKWVHENDGNEVAAGLSAGYLPGKDQRSEQEHLIGQAYQGELTSVSIYGGCRLVQHGQVYEMNGIFTTSDMERLKPHVYYACSPIDRKDLAERMVHQVLRQHGHLWPTQLVTATSKALFEVYKHKRSLALDALMILADILLVRNGGCTVEEGHALSEIGEVLEAMERYDTAGRIYMDSAQVFSASQNNNNSQESAMSWQNAGLAFRRGGVHSDAKKCYFTALKIMRASHEKKWNLNGRDVTLVITNFLVLFDELNKGSASLCVTKDDERVMHVFCAILFGAGFRASQGGLSHSMVFHLGKSLHKSGFLGSQFSKPKECRRVLEDEALCAEDYDGFCAALMGALPPNSIVMSFGERPKPRKDEERDIDLKAAKDQMRQAVGYGKAAGKCYNPTCNLYVRGSKLQRCPCEAITYCGKQCQKEHWKVHKTICPWKAKQAAQKK